MKRGMFAVWKKTTNTVVISSTHLTLTQFVKVPRENNDILWNVAK